MPKLEKKLSKAVEDIIAYSVSLQPSPKLVHNYVRAHSLLNILLPSTSQKAWKEIDQRLEEHHIKMYR